MKRRSREFFGNSRMELQVPPLGRGSGLPRTSTLVYFVFLLFCFSTSLSCLNLFLVTLPAFLDLDFWIRYVFLFEVSDSSMYSTVHSLAFSMQHARMYPVKQGRDAQIIYIYIYIYFFDIYIYTYIYIYII